MIFIATLSLFPPSFSQEIRVTNVTTAPSQDGGGWTAGCDMTRDTAWPMQLTPSKGLPDRPVREAFWSEYDILSTY